MPMIAIVRDWVSRRLNAKSSRLLIEAITAGRNRVRLRFEFEDGTGECDVATLVALKRKRCSTEELDSALRAIKP